MADFPILKWVNIDGKNVPFIYPQHKNGENYVETGTENPLPIANYVQKNGLWLPVSEENPVPTKTELTGSSLAEGEAIPTKNVRKVIIDTLLDSESVEPNSWSTLKDIGYTSETDIWFAVNIDQQPWSLNTDIFTYNHLIQLSTPKGHGVYPPKNRESSAFTNPAYPSTSLWLGGIYLHSAFGLSMPTTVEGAFQSKTGYFEGAKVGIQNESENTATVTLKVIRVWR